MSQTEIASINASIATATSIASCARDAITMATISDDTREALAEIRRMHGGK